MYFLLMVFINDYPYTVALLLNNYRCHESILSLPSDLFFESALQVRTHNKLHPKTSSALKFICTSMDSSAVVSMEDESEEEAKITLEQVIIMYVTTKLRF